ncbi:unnamed protein product [Penicillium crustosum]
MESESNPSTSSLIALCIRDFHTLLDYIPGKQNEIRLKVQDDMGMLRVWVGNFGAHRKHTDRLSLDHRLREAPDLHREVQNHIRDITDAIQGAISFFSGSEESFGVDDASAGSEMHELDADDSDSDGFWDQIKEESGEHSKLNEYMIDIQYTITSLYKFSLTLQNPAHRDRTAQASRIELGHFEFYDIQHVSDKYNIPWDSTLAQRLGKANTRRRQLLAYHKDHTEKISRYVDVAVQKAIEVPRASIKDTRTRSISTKWTQDTTASTIYHHDDDSISDSGQTKFSETTSTAGDQAHILIPPPPPADVVNTIQNHPFFCPYCRQTIQLENMDEDWKYHVYSDLRPYICTFGDCVKANQLYDSYTEWSEHERQFHRREWVCNLCSLTFNSEALFRNHLRAAHAGVLPEDQQQAIMNLSERSISSAQQCPLCTKPPISNPSRFQQHLARHLQQLSLFILPRRESEENEHAARDGESNESQQVLGIEDEAITSLKSISISQRSGHTLSEVSESDDQPQVPEAENHLETQDQVDKELQEIENNKTTIGPEHPVTVKSMKKLALTYRNQNKFAEAVKLLEQVAVIQNAKLGEDHPSTLNNMSKIALLYIEQGNLLEALKLDIKVFERKKLTLGLRDLSTLRAMENVSTSYARLGRYEERELIAHQLVDLGEEVLSPTNRSLLKWKMSLVSTYQGQSKLDSAENLGREVAATCQESFGTNHPLTLASMAKLESIYRSQCRWADAEELGNELVKTSEFVHGKTHRETLELMSKLCSTIRNQGRLDEAKDLGEKVIRDMAKAGMDREECMLFATTELAMTYHELQLLPEAEAIACCSLRLMEETIGKDHIYTKAAMRSLSSIYESQNKLDAAKELMEMAHARRE